MKYRLKKDLPGKPAGTVLGDSIDDNEEPYLVNLMAHAHYLKEWFEPIEDKPKWDVNIYKSGVEGYECCVDVTLVCTKKQAEAVAEAIKKLLEYVHTPFFDTAVAHQLHSNVISKTASVARRAVQEDA